MCLTGMCVCVCYLCVCVLSVRVCVICACVLPVCVDEGVEGESVPPAGREVLHVDAGVARRFPLTPDQKSLLR